MKTFPIFLLIASALFMSACKKNVPLHTFSPAAIERQGGPDCNTEEGRCARLELGYPVAEGPIAQTINDSIASNLARILLMLNPDGVETNDLSLLADQYLKSYEEFLQDVPDYEMGWWLEGSYEIHRNDAQTISIELMISSYTGGAHPIGFSQTLNFSVDDGSIMSWDDLINDKAAWLKLVEKEFKNAWDLPETASLQEEGFFWDKTFFLPNNFALTDEGVYFIYNVYEAAPYALGPTEFLIPYETAKPFLKISL